MQLDILKTPSGFLKLWEIGITIIIVSVTQGVEDFLFGNQHRTIFCGGVMVIALVVTPLLLVTYLSGHAREMQRAPFEMLFNATLAVFMVSAGAVTINTSFDLGTLAETNVAETLSKAADAGKAAGSFAIVNGVFYGLDAFFARQNME